MTRTEFLGRMRRGLASLVEPLLVVAVMFISTTAIAQPFYIPSGSMEPTLAIGDYLLATKYTYGYSRYSHCRSLWVPRPNSVCGAACPSGET